MLRKRPRQNRSWIGLVLLAAWWIAACAVFSIPKAFAADDIVGTFEQTVPVGCAAGTVNVTTSSGDVNVRPGNDGEVHVRGIVRIDPETWGLPNPSPEQAIALLQQQPPIDQDGNTLNIGSISDPNLTQNVSISYEVKVPLASKLKVQIGSGSVDIHQIDGDVDASTSVGHVTVTDITGSVNASTQSGDVDVRSITGTATVFSGGTGAINGTDLAAPKVTATNGPVKFLDVHGSCEVSVDDGDISVNGAPSAPWTLHTKAGTVAISVTNPANFELNAETLKGDVHNSLPLSQVGSTESGTAVGNVGDGGPKVDLSTGVGDISIE